MLIAMSCDEGNTKGSNFQSKFRSHDLMEYIISVENKFVASFNTDKLGDLFLRSTV